MPNLALGTAQLGMRYGISHMGDMPTAEHVCELISYAKQEQIEVLDTASAYGESEERLGQNDLSGFKLVTKVSAVEKSHHLNLSGINNQLNDSLQRLNTSHVYGLLIHDPRVLVGDYGKSIWKNMISLRERGLVRKIGYSVYDLNELAVLVKSYRPEIVQLPLSIADRRFALDGWLDKLQDLGVEIHARSIFLQGLLLMKREQRPGKFATADPFFNEWDDWCETNACSKLNECINFVMRHNQVKHIVVGAQNVEQLRELVNASKNATDTQVPGALKVTSPLILNPSKWSEL